MAELYTYEDLTDIPSIGMIENRIAESISTPINDISYHSDEKWLKVWFQDALSHGDKVVLDQIVDDSVGVKSFRNDTGSVFFRAVARR